MGMNMDERVFNDTVAAVPDAGQVGWFAARQPAILRYLEARCGGPNDAFAVALEAAWRMCIVMERATGRPPARVTHTDLLAAERVAAVDAAGAMLSSSIAARHPQLCGWLGDFLADPPALLTVDERRTVGDTLVTVLICVLVTAL